MNIPELKKAKIIDMLEGYELNIERCKTNSERRRYRFELAQRIISLIKDNLQK